MHEQSSYSVQMKASKRLERPTKRAIMAIIMHSDKTLPFGGVSPLFCFVYSWLLVSVGCFKYMKPTSNKTMHQYQIQILSPAIFISLKNLLTLESCHYGKNHDLSINAPSWILQSMCITSIQVVMLGIENSLEFFFQSLFEGTPNQWLYFPYLVASWQPF